MFDPSPTLDPQTHLIYLLLDSNLPTGGFVASSGLESWAKHGFLGDHTGYNAPPLPPTGLGRRGQGGGPGQGGGGVGNSAGPTVAARRVTEFLDAEVENYARSTGGYVKGGWEAVRGLMQGSRGVCGSCGKTVDGAGIPTSTKESSLAVGAVSSADGPDVIANGTKEGERTAIEGSGQAGPTTWSTPSLPDSWTPPTPEELDDTLQRILALDKAHESTLLSHVSRRASKAQGVAILTLYTKGLSRPPGYGDDDGEAGAEVGEREQEEVAAAVVEGYKRLIRKGVAPGHLAVCWGLMTAGLGLSLDKSYHLYLFLHARSVLSAAVRLNLIGPYLSSQLLLHPTKTIIEKYATTFGADTSSGPCACNSVQRGSGEGEDFWDWTAEAESGPATIWPLGEVLIARHDHQHSRIFNS